MKLTVDNHYKNFLEDKFSLVEQEKSSKQRHHFLTQALKATVQLLLSEKEISSSLIPKRYGHLAQEIVSLSQLKERIKRVSGFVKQEESGNSLQLVTAYASIEYRTHRVKATLRSVTDFCFSSSKALRNRLQATSKVLNGKDLFYSGLQKAESVIFHFLALKCLNTGKKTININDLEGQSAHQSLYAFLTVWDIYTKGFSQDQMLELQAQIRQLLTDALSCALRADFITDNWCGTPEDEESYEKLADFYPSFAALEKIRKSSPQKSLAECILNLEEQDRVNISKFCEEPLEDTLSNNLLLDSIYKTECEALQKLAVGQSQIRLLGSHDHCIVCEFQRENENSYNLIIYNPSYYTRKGGHEVKKEGEQSFVKPLKIKQLTLHDLTNYEFLHRLWFICCEENIENDKIVLFYEHIQEALVKKARGKIVKEEGIWFPIPQYGICTTASIMMFLINRLDQKDLFKLEKAILIYCQKVQAMINKAIQDNFIHFDQDSEDDSEEDGHRSLEEIKEQAKWLSFLIQERLQQMR